MANTEKLKRSSSAVVSAALTIGILVMLNIFALRLFVRADLTEEKAFSLAPASKEIVQGLEDTLRVKAYFTSDLPARFEQNRRFLRDLLDEYRAFSKGRMRYEFIDPSEDDDLKQELRNTGVPEVDVQVVEQDKMQVRKCHMGVVLHYGDKKEVIPYLQGVTNLEYDISSLIKRLTRERIPVLGILQGHGEPSMQEELQALAQLTNQQYELRPVESASADIPGDVDALLIIAPKQALTEVELYRIDQFVMAGKPVGFMLDRVTADMKQFTAESVTSGLEQLLTHYGASPQEALVLDARNARINVSTRQGFMVIQQAMEYFFFPLLVRFEDGSVLTKGLANLSFPYVSPIEIRAPEGVETETIFKTSEKSWLQTDSFQIHPLQMRENQPDTFDGPHALGVTLKGKFSSFYADKPVPSDGGADAPAEAEKKESLDTRLMVIGDGDFLRDEFMGRDRVKQLFAANLVDWLLSDEGLIAVRARGGAPRPLEETEAGQRSLMRYGNIVGVPLLFIGLGFLRWNLRQVRRRRASL